MRNSLLIATALTAVAGATPAMADDIKIKPLIDARLRYEHVEQAPLADPAKAVPVTGAIEGEQATVVPSLSAEVYGPRTTPPVEGIAPDPTVTGAAPVASYGLEDRGIAKTVHAADAMKSMYDMGDAPSCSTCGAIMVRNGSCYRCMSCGSTSGCS